MNDWIEDEPRLVAAIKAAWKECAAKGITPDNADWTKQMMLRLLLSTVSCETEEVVDGEYEHTFTSPDDPVR